MKNRIFLFLFLSCVSCSVDRKEKAEMPHIKAFHHVNDIIVPKLQKKFSLHAGCTGWSLMDRINCISYTIMMDGQRNREEVRKIAIQATEYIKSEINKIRECRPFFKEYPYTEYGLTVEIVFKSLDGSSIDPPFPSAVATVAGSVLYFYEVPDEEFGHYKEEESYQEALKLVEMC